MSRYTDFSRAPTLRADDAEIPGTEFRSGDQVPSEGGKKTLLRTVQIFVLTMIYVAVFYGVLAMQISLMPIVFLGALAAIVYVIYVSLCEYWQSRKSATDGQNPSPLGEPDKRLY